MATEIEFGAQSDTGCVRENNEDSYRVAPEMSLFVLSDGMGGLESGEVASRMAVDTVLGALPRGGGESVAAVRRRAHPGNLRRVQSPGERHSTGE